MSDEKRDDGFEEALDDLNHSATCTLDWMDNDGQCSCDVEHLRQRLRALRGVPREKVGEMLIRMAKQVAALYMGASPLIPEPIWNRINEAAAAILREELGDGGDG